MTGWTPTPAARLGGVAVTTASRPELVALFAADRALPGRRPPRLVFDANAHGLSLYARDPAYRAALDRADLIHADGGFLVTLSRRLGGARIGGRSCTTDMFDDFAAAGAAQGWRFYLLGASEEVNARCAAMLAERWPGLVIAGRHHGYFDADGLPAVADAIVRAKPDIVWVGLGKPVEQIVSVELALRVGATWLVTCGGCFNYMVGAYPRAPRWMRDNNLEWLHRLWSDPRRLAWRYLTTNPHALWVVAASAFRERRAQGAARRPPTARAASRV